MRDRSPQGVWETALGQLELQVARPNFETWLRHTVGLDLQADQFIVGVPTDFAIEWLRSRMAGQISRSISQVLGSEVTAVFQVLGAPALSDPPAVNSHGLVRAAHRPPPNLNPALAFESFTVVKSNRFAYRACRRAASGEGRYNPLIIVAGSGLGKTHLLHATGHEAHAAGKRVLAFTGETFVDGYVKSVRGGSPHAFRDLFDACSLFLLDDLPFLTSKAGSLNLFARIVDSLMSRGCQIVVTSHTALDPSSALPAALRSRLSAGLAADIHPLSEEERLPILRAKASCLAQPLPARLLQTISRQPYQSARELEGALNRADAFAELTAGPVAEDDLIRALYPLEPLESPSVTLDGILSAVAEYLSLRRDQIAGPSRSRDVTYGRHLAIYLSRRHASLPLSQIGQALGGRDHSTILNGFRRIDRECRSLPQTRADVEALEQVLGRFSAA